MTEMTEQTERYPRVASVRATARRCEAEGIGLCYKTLLALTKTGALPVIRSGSRSLIVWDSLESYLETGGEKNDVTAAALPFKRRGARGGTR